MKSSDVIALVKPGMLGLVSYVKPNLVEEGIALAEGSPYEHCLCLAGGDDLFEAIAKGFQPGRLLDYLNPLTNLLILDIPGVTDEQRQAIVKTWQSMVGEPYGFLADAGDGILEILRRIGIHEALDLPNFMASNKAPNCSMSGAMGWAHGAGFKFREPLGSIMPSTLAAEPGTLVVGTIIGNELQ